MREKLSQNVCEFIQDSHFLDFPSAILQIFHRCENKDLIDSNLLYQKIKNSLTDILCLLPFLDTFKLDKKFYSSLFKSIDKLREKIDDQDDSQGTVKPTDEILRLKKEIDEQKNDLINKIKEKDEIINKMKEENEQLLKQVNSNGIDNQDDSKKAIEPNDDITKLKKSIEKYKKKVKELKDENDNLRNQLNSNDINDQDDSQGAGKPTDEILRLKKEIEEQKNDFINQIKEKDEIINKTKEKNKQLLQQVNSNGIDKGLNQGYLNNISKQKIMEQIGDANNNDIQTKDKIKKLLESNKAYKLRYKQMKSEKNDIEHNNYELMESNQKYKKQISDLTKEKGKMNQFILKLQDEISKLKRPAYSENKKDNYAVKQPPSTNTKTDIFGSSSKNKRSDYHPPTSQKELRRIKIFNENKSIVKKGYYMLYNRPIYIQTDYDYSLSHTETISSKVSLSFDQKFYSNQKIWSKKEQYSIYPKIEVWEASTFYEAIMMKKKVSNKVCCLNFASSTQPGGGVLNGRNAQEEVLSRQSTLYFSLATQKQFYEHNKNYYDSFGTDYMIYSPNVLIIRNDNDELIDPVKVSIISAVAVNYSEIQQKYPKGTKDTDVYEVMKKRCRRILQLCLNKGNDVIILGAFGCGVFKNSPEDVSNIFKELLVDEFYGMYFQKIIFAIKIKPGESDEMLHIFKDAFHPPVNHLRRYHH